MVFTREDGDFHGRLLLVYQRVHSGKTWQLKSPGTPIPPKQHRLLTHSLHKGTSNPEVFFCKGGTAGDDRPDRPDSC